MSYEASDTGTSYLRSSCACVYGIVVSYDITVGIKLWMTCTVLETIIYELLFIYI